MRTTPTGTSILASRKSRQQRLQTFLDDMPRPVSPLGYVTLVLAATAATAMIYLLWTIGTGLIGVLTDGAQRLNDPGAGWRPNEPVIRTITAPVQTYLLHHAGGLPAAGGRLFTFWVVLVVALWACASVGARGARIGWILIGALTTAMVYAATAPVSRHLAAGITIAVWALMSVTALRRRTHRCAATVTDEIPSPKSRTRDDDARAS